MGQADLGDLVDLGRSWLKGVKGKRMDTVKQKSGKLHISALPVAGYTLQTGFAGVLSSNFAFYTSEHSQANMSTENRQKWLENLRQAALK